MKSITIHKLDTDLVKAIEGISNATNLSQNKVIKKLLRKALGLDGNEPIKRDVSAVFGVWTAEDAANFEEATTVFNTIATE